MSVSSPLEAMLIFDISDMSNVPSKSADLAYMEPETSAG